MLDILKILFCIPFLLYSCYSDIKTRRVTNKLWSIMLAGSVFFILYDISKEGITYLLHLFISVGLIFAFVYILFQFGTFGGADAKSLIVLSTILPMYPMFEVFGYIFPLNMPLTYLKNFFALSILLNSVVLAMSVPIGLAVYNIMKIGLRIDNPLYIFIGYKTKISKLLSKQHIKMLQDFEEVDGIIKFHFKHGGVEINENTIHELNSLSKRGLIKDEIWVTPGLPFMVPITAGFFMAALYGDLITELTKYIIFKLI